VTGFNLSLVKCEGCGRVIAGSPNMARHRNACTANLDIFRRRLAARSELRPNGCIEWTGRRDHHGYGRTDVGRKPMLAHRLAWLVAHGTLPADREVRHGCDNPPCINTAHLSLGTHAENMRDGAERKRMRQGGGAKLSADDVRTIRQLHAKGDTVAVLSRRYGMSWPAINEVVTGTSWRSI
jgi:hypothetical protein